MTRIIGYIHSIVRERLAWSQFFRFIQWIRKTGDKSSSKSLIIGGMIVVSGLGLVRGQGITIPTNLNNAVITIRNIFLSTDGVSDTGDNVTISLNGANGSIQATSVGAQAMTTNTLDAQTATITTLQSTDTTTQTLDAGSVDTDTLDAQTATITTLQSTDITTQTLDAGSVDTNMLLAGVGTFKRIGIVNDQGDETITLVGSSGSIIADDIDTVSLDSNVITSEEITTTVLNATDIVSSSVTANTISSSIFSGSTGSLSYLSLSPLSDPSTMSIVLNGNAGEIMANKIFGFNGLLNTFALYSGSDINQPTISMNGNNGSIVVPTLVGQTIRTVNLTSEVITGSRLVVSTSLSSHYGQDNDLILQPEPGGNVAIGRTSANARLDVEGNAIIRNNDNAQGVMVTPNGLNRTEIRNGNSTTYNTLHFANMRGNNSKTSYGMIRSQYVASPTSAGVPSPLLLQPDGGTIGINTLNPVATLDINGTMKINNPLIQPNTLLMIDSGGYLVSAQEEDLIEETPLWVLNGTGVFNNLGYNVGITPGGYFDFGSASLGVLGGFKVVDTNASNISYFYRGGSETFISYTENCNTTSWNSADGRPNPPINPTPQPSPQTIATLAPRCPRDTDLDKRQSPTTSTMGSLPLSCIDIYVDDQIINAVPSSDPYASNNQTSNFGYDVEEVWCYEYKTYTRGQLGSEGNTTAFAIDTTANTITTGFPLVVSSGLTFGNTSTLTTLEATNHDTNNNSSDSTYLAVDAGTTSPHQYKTITNKTFCALGKVEIHGQGTCNIYQDPQSPRTWKLQAIRNGDGSRAECRATCF